MSSTILSATSVAHEQVEKERKAQKTAEVCGDKLETCTFDDGYITQSVYVCLTCSTPDKPMAGMCLGCSMNCHLDHEIMELWTKRAFRCDCGTSRLSKPCCLRPKTNVTNEKNKYTDNFRGLYCYCKQDETDDSGDMYMCSRCEDWFHWKCLEMPGEAPDPDTFLCNPCARSVPHLLPYTVAAADAKSEINADLPDNVLQITKKADNCCECETASDSSENVPQSRKRKTSQEDGPPKKRRRTEKNNCSRKVVSPEQTEDLLKAKGFFFSAGWTDSLCRCESCESLLKSGGMDHIFEDDPANDFFDDINVTEVDRTEPVKPTFSMNGLASAAITQLPATRVLDVLAEQMRFHNAIKEELRNINGVVTEYTMRNIIARVKNQLRYGMNMGS